MARPPMQRPNTCRWLVRVPPVCEAHGRSLRSPLLASPLLALVCRAPSWPRRSKPCPRDRPMEARWRALPTHQVARRRLWPARSGSRGRKLRSGGIRSAGCGGRARGRSHPTFRSRFDSSSKRAETAPKHLNHSTRATKTGKQGAGVAGGGPCRVFKGFAKKKCVPHVG